MQRSPGPQADGESGESDQLGVVLGHFRAWPDQCSLELATLDELTVLARTLVAELLERDSACEENRIQRELARTQMCAEKVNREDEAER